MSGQPSPSPFTSERGQLVLVAAVFIAVSFVPITVAYLQLGYNADVQASSDTTRESLESTVRHLQRGVHTETNNTTTLSQRNHTVTAIHSRLEPHISAIETEHTTVRVAYNESAAREWTITNCPNGSARRFGSCTADRGVVVQQRLNETHIVAVAFDVTLTSDRERIEATVILNPTGRLVERRLVNGVTTATKLNGLRPSPRHDHRLPERDPVSENRSHPTAVPISLELVRIPSI